MRLFDVSLALHEGMVRWPGDPAYIRQEVATLTDDGYAVARLTLGSHTGTHIDAPAHMVPDGLTIDRIPLEVLVGPAVVWNVSDRRAISAQDLVGLTWPSGLRRLLLKTDNSRRGLLRRTTFAPAYVALAPDAAAWLVAQDVCLVGIDALSVDPPEDEAAHQALLAQGVVIVEGLDLADVPPGVYTLCCLPLPIIGGDGAPARVILWNE